MFHCCKNHVKISLSDGCGMGEPTWVLRKFKRHATSSGIIKSSGQLAIVWRISYGVFTP